jgi:hypothetical protein
MKNLESVYLTEKEGITSTSANYLANLAKETLRDAEMQLKTITFLNKTAELINGDKKEIQKGWKNPRLAIELIDRIAEMHSFIAWMREAINAKENIINACESYSFEQYVSDNNIILPTSPLLKSVTEAQIINEMNIKERQRYLMLESYAAAYGQYIHPKGEFAEARDDMYLRINHPTVLSGNGRDMVIFTYSESVPVDEVESTFLASQAKHREYEKQLNAIKFQIKEEVNKRNTENLLQHKAELKEYKLRIDEAQNEWKQEVIKLREKASKLKIVIPNNLQDTYKYLESLVE